MIVTREANKESIIKPGQPRFASLELHAPDSIGPIVVVRHELQGALRRVLGAADFQTVKLQSQGPRLRFVIPQERQRLRFHFRKSLDDAVKSIQCGGIGSGLTSIQRETDRAASSFHLAGPNLEFIRSERTKFRMHDRSRWRALAECVSCNGNRNPTKFKRDHPHQPNDGNREHDDDDNMVRRGDVG
jgi:hypothetical protein